MAERDLTFNRPPPDQVDDIHSNDPYNQPTTHQNIRQNDNPFADSSSLESRHNSFNLSDEDTSHYGKPFNVYNNSFPSRDGTSSNLLSHQSSVDDLRNPSQQNLHSPDSPGGIHVPPEFDRYPTMNNSNSRNSLNSHLYNSANNSNGQLNGALAYSSTNNLLRSEDDSSSMSDKSADPFVQSADYSPFGGYPASSFPLHIDEKEPDDYLHNPDPVADAAYDNNRFMYDLKNMDRRSLGGMIGLIILFLGAAFIFIVFPVLTYSGVTSTYKPEAYEKLTQYKYPLISSIRTDLVDPDTPSDALWKENRLGKKWKLAFSDEFNVEGRTFYEDDDQFFNGLDTHYDATKDLEWYDPDAVTTANGSLVLTMDAYKNHDLYYRSGMVQSWNKLCFNEGMIMISARLPNYGNVSGLWPGLWTMGNLGRPGYTASTEGLWPYTYDSCDAGITANQSSPDGISYLPGQRLNSCTCPGEDHPNRGTGRGAPEIDIIEGEVDSNIKNGVASQSYQLAPFDIWYYPDYNFVEIHDLDVTSMNTYTGGPLQQAFSATTTLNTQWYERGDEAGEYQVYGYEYLNDNDDGYLTWYVGTPTMTVHSYALAPNGNIGWRRIPKEPMSIIMNLGISNNWAYIDWPSLLFPVQMHIDYVRIYQPEDNILMTCDPEDYPTYDYIQDHLNIYENVNLTSFEDGGYSFPKNKLVHGCD